MPHLSERNTEDILSYGEQAKIRGRFKQLGVHFIGRSTVQVHFFYYGQPVAQAFLAPLRVWKEKGSKEITIELAWRYYERVYARYSHRLLGFILDCSQEQYMRLIDDPEVKQFEEKDRLRVVGLLTGEIQHGPLREDKEYVQRQEKVRDHRHRRRGCVPSSAR